MVAEVGELGLEGREVVGGGGAAMLVDGDQRGGPALGEDVLRLAFAGADADADRDHARLLAAEEGGVDGAAVGDHHADPVAAAEAQLPQRSGDAVGGALVAGPAERAEGSGEGDRVGALAGVAGDVVGQRQVGPPALAVVLGSDPLALGPELLHVWKPIKRLVQSATGWRT